MSSFVRNLEDRPRGLIKDFIYVKDNSLTKDFCIHVIKKFDEDTLGKVFLSFTIETILLGKIMNINPFDQPAVEQVKILTKKFLKLKKS